jgi:hypothetical protein
MDIKFEPYRINLEIVLTPNEAAEICKYLENFEPLVEVPETVMKLHSSLNHISAMSVDHLLENMNAVDFDEHTLQNSRLPHRYPDRERAGQRHDSRP